MVMIQGESLGQRAELEIRHEDDDDTLLDRLRGGDEVAFRALVDRHRPWLVRLCTRLLGQDAHAAEDAAQESLLKLHRAARQGRPLRVRPWLTVVARNTCVDEQRRRRPDLPGEVPERAAPGEDPFEPDAALTDAWSRLAGRHREVLYLREVLGFSYKEIGTVMGLTMPATETLLFRARAALRREYERSGGTSFGCGVLGFHLARLGFGPRRQEVVTAGAPSTSLGEVGLTGLTSRLGQFLTAFPGCGEQAVAKALSVAAGVAVAAVAVIPGLGPFADVPRAGAADAPASAVTATGAVAASAENAAPTGGPVVLLAPAKAPTLRMLLGNAVPAGWAPQSSRREAPAMPAVSPPAAVGSRPPSARTTALRDAASAARPTVRPTLRREDSQPGPVLSILAARPDTDHPAGPAQPLRTLLGAFPVLIGQPPVEPAPGELLPLPGTESYNGELSPDGGNVGGHEPALLRRRHR